MQQPAESPRPARRYARKTRRARGTRPGKSHTRARCSLRLATKKAGAGCGPPGAGPPPRPRAAALLRARPRRVPARVLRLRLAPLAGARAGGASPPPSPCRSFPPAVVPHCSWGTHSTHFAPKKSAQRRSSATPCLASWLRSGVSKQPAPSAQNQQRAARRLRGGSYRPPAPPQRGVRPPVPPLRLRRQRRAAGALPLVLERTPHFVPCPHFALGKSAQRRAVRGLFGFGSSVRVFPLCSMAVKALRARNSRMRSAWNAPYARSAERRFAALTAMQMGCRPERVRKVCTQ